MAGTTEFAWPWEFSFPPFFTIQPNQATREKQLDSWTTLVCAYCRHRKQLTLGVASSDGAAGELFANKAINRQLNADGVRAVAEHMVASGKAVWLDLADAADAGKTTLVVLWRSADDWAKLIYDFAVGAGLTSTVCTLFELVQGDDTTDQEFYGMDVAVLKLFLQTLVQQGRAELIGDDEGVKFF